MIQNPPLLLLDLDVVHHIFPGKDGSLLLDDSLVNLVGASLLARSGEAVLFGIGAARGLRFGIIRLFTLELTRDLAAGIDKDLAFGALCRDKLCSRKIYTEECNNWNISSFSSRNRSLRREAVCGRDEHTRGPLKRRILAVRGQYANIPPLMRGVVLIRHIDVGVAIDIVLAENRARYRARSSRRWNVRIRR